VRAAIKKQQVVEDEKVSSSALYFGHDSFDDLDAAKKEEPQL